MAYQLPSAYISRGMIKSGLVVFFLFCVFVSVLHMGYSPNPHATWSNRPSNQNNQNWDPTPPIPVEDAIPEKSHNEAAHEPTHGSGLEKGKTEWTTQSPLVLSDEDAKAVCSEHGFEVFPDRKTRKVYDLFLAGTELDWLEIRMNTLDSVVDYFVIVEASKTFTYQPKALYFKENFKRFEKFADKIIYRVLDFDGMEQASTWDREKYQRNALFNAVFPGLVGDQVAYQYDVLLVSDLDEIPKEDTITMLRNCMFPKRVTIRSQFYYYSFEWEHHGSDWNHPQATYYNMEDTIRPEDLRMGSGDIDLKNASWHCSSCFSTVAEMSKKIESFSHTEYNHARFKDPAQIVRRVRNGLDLFDRKGQDYDMVKDNQDVPTYLKLNREKFPYLLDRSPANANFIDFFGEGAKSLDEFTGDMNDKR